MGNYRGTSGVKLLNSGALAKPELIKLPDGGKMET